MTRNKPLKTGSAIEPTTSSSSVENDCTNLPAVDVCESWLQTLARANGEAGSVPNADEMDYIWRGVRWTIGYRQEMDADVDE